MTRRRHDRIAYRELVQVQAHGDTHGCELLDISHGGLRLKRCLEARQGDTVKVFVPLPIPFRDRRRFCCLAGIVAWATDEQVGVEFEEVPIETFAQLEVGLEAIGADDAIR